MSDEGEPGALPEFYFDGVMDIHIVEAVFRFTMFSRQRSTSGRVRRVAVAKATVPVARLPDIARKTVEAVMKTISTE